MLFRFIKFRIHASFQSTSTLLLLTIFSTIHRYDNVTLSPLLIAGATVRFCSLEQKRTEGYVFVSKQYPPPPPQCFLQRLLEYN